MESICKLIHVSLESRQDFLDFGLVKPIHASTDPQEITGRLGEPVRRLQYTDVLQRKGDQTLSVLENLRKPNRNLKGTQNLPLLRAITKA